MSYLQKLVYLSEAQKNTLFTTGSVTVDGVTITYNPNDLYVTPTDISPSDASPQPLGTAAAGSSEAYSRADHVHAKPTASDVGAYVKPQSGIPASDLAAGVVPQTVTISGSTPTITGAANTQYICGECSTLDITLPASGCVDVVFESGSTPTALTVIPPTGVTLKWANGFDPTSLEANTTYEINIMDGCLGVAASWT